MLKKNTIYLIIDGEIIEPKCVRMQVDSVLFNEEDIIILSKFYEEMYNNRTLNIKYLYVGNDYNFFYYDINLLGIFFEENLSYKKGFNAFSINKNFYIDGILDIKTEYIKPFIKAIIKKRLSKLNHVRNSN